MDCGGNDAALSWWRLDHAVGLSVRTLAPRRSQSAAYGGALHRRCRGQGMPMTRHYLDAFALRPRFTTESTENGMAGERRAGLRLHKTPKDVSLLTLTLYPRLRSV